MKLVEILARELEEWPADCRRITQRANNELVGSSGFGYSRTLTNLPYLPVVTASDRVTALVTRHQWKSARAAYLASIQPERDAEIAKVVGGTKKLPYAFTEADIRAAFAAGANWVLGAIEDGAAEYVEKLKGHK